MESRSDIGWLVGYNNSTKERTPLTVTHSNDDGQTWNHVVDCKNRRKRAKKASLSLSRFEQVFSSGNWQRTVFVSVCLSIATRSKQSFCLLYARTSQWHSHHRSCNYHIQIKRKQMFIDFPKESIEIENQFELNIPNPKKRFQCSRF